MALFSEVFSMTSTTSITTIAMIFIEAIVARKAFHFL